MKKVGVLALQGAFREHKQILESLGVDVVEVRLPKDLDGVQAIIIPGGESTTIGKLAVLYELIEPLRELAKSKPMWGTCAGMIFMSKEIGLDQPLLKVMDIEVERNAFGRQVDSFIAPIDIDGVTAGAPFDAVFIRAPRLVAVHENARPIATLPDGTMVAAQQGNLLVTSFHPELRADSRLHQYFL